MREPIKEALQSDGVKAILRRGENKVVDIFDDDYLAKIEQIKLPNTKIKLLQHLLDKAITDFKQMNKTKGIDFAQQLKGLVDMYNERRKDDVLVSEVLAEFSSEIVNLIHALKKEREPYTALGINVEAKAFYDILKGLASKYDFTYPEDKLLSLANVVKTVVAEKVQRTDWNQRDDIKAELKERLILLLTEHGYPPVDRDEVYKEIFAQAEKFKKYQHSSPAPC